MEVCTYGSMIGVCIGVLLVHDGKLCNCSQMQVTNIESCPVKQFAPLQMNTFQNVNKI